MTTTSIVVCTVLAAATVVSAASAPKTKLSATAWLVGTVLGALVTVAIINRARGL